LLDRVQPGRRIHGISAVFLPFDSSGRADLDAFRTHIARTAGAGLVPAVNMDTGFGPELDPAQRVEVLRVAREVVDGDLVAGVFEPYAGSVGDALDARAIPIVFPSPALAAADDAAAMYADIVEPCDRALAFELGSQFVPHGRVWDLATIARLMDIPALAGLKHSSLDRLLELERLRLRDERRPDFHIYTGNDLAIDMVMFGSDYLLGLSTFDPEAFAIRDAWWAACDPRFFALNDALQAVGSFAFREPVPAYKSSAAAYLRVTGQLPGALAHPGTPRRPDWEEEVLRTLAARVDQAAGRR
jgi:dihydrodipicolinate synthase/N-acetylneuraminate lyase